MTRVRLAPPTLFCEALDQCTHLVEWNKHAAKLPYQNSCTHVSLGEKGHSDVYYYSLLSEKSLCPKIDTRLYDYAARYSYINEEDKIASPLLDYKTKWSSFCQCSYTILVSRRKMAFGLIKRALRPAGGDNQLLSNLSNSLYVCMYVCMYVYMYICMCHA